MSEFPPIAKWVEYRQLKYLRYSVPLRPLQNFKRSPHLDETRRWRRERTIRKAGNKSPHRLGVYDILGQNHHFF